MVRYFQEALAGEGRVFAGNSVFTPALMQAHDYVITPRIHDENYIGFLLDFCERNKIDAVIPLFDVDLPVLSENRARFDESGIKVVVSDTSVLEICNDKWETARFCRENNINHPRTYISRPELFLDISAGKTVFPLVLKPRWGMGSLGVVTADTPDELHVLYCKLERDIFSTYLKYESGKDPGACIVIQEKVAGQEYGLDILNDLSGNYVTTVAKRKIAMRSGETDVAQIVGHEPFLETARTVSEKLRHIGNLDVDCFLSGRGELTVLEMNARFGGQYPFSHMAGVDFPKQIVKWLSGCKTDGSLLIPQIGTTGCKDLLPVKLECP
jgi:hypothetical protein